MEHMHELHVHHLPTLKEPGRQRAYVDGAVVPSSDRKQEQTVPSLQPSQSV